MRAIRAIALVAAVAVSVPGVAGAQSDARLVGAVRLAQEGHSDSARAEVSRLLSATPPTDTLYPEILYTQAMVAADAGAMRTLLQRVVVEHPASSWADEALLRLVQMDYATRNLDGAARNLERLRSDYPTSPLMAQASYWAGRVYFDQSNAALACRWLREGMGQAGGNIELQNQLGYLNQRCANVAVATTDTGRAGADSARVKSDSTRARPDSTTRAAADSAGKPPAADTTATAPPGKTVYRVQIAAVGSKAAAAAAERKARALGLTVTTLHENSLYKVRAGQYPSRDAAQAAAAGLKVKLGGNPFVVSEP